MDIKDNREYVVYKHTNKNNNKVYFGITSTDIYTRSGSNGKNYKKNKYFYRAIQKYGWNNFEHKTLFTKLSLEEASRIERDLIAKYKSNNNEYGYNLSSGGEGGNTGCSMSDEEKERRRQKLSGSGNPCFGLFGSLHPSYGHIKSENEITKIRDIHKNKIVSEETRQKLSATKKEKGDWSGNKNPMFGRTYGNAPQARKVICVDTGIIFNSIKETAEFMGVSSNAIQAVCIGKYKTSCGMKFEYYNEIDEEVS